MIDRTVIGIGLATFAIALIAPHLNSGAVGAAGGDGLGGTFSETASTPSPSPAMTARPGPVAAIAGGSVQLQRDGDSHFRASTMVNGRPVRMLVDSGASLVVLTEADARSVGLYLSPSDFTESADTAGGVVKVAPLVIDRIAINGIERRQIRAAVVPGTLLSQSLLGQSFLGQLGEVAIRGNVMTLR